MTVTGGLVSDYSFAFVGTSYAVEAGLGNGILIEDIGNPTAQDSYVGTANIFDSQAAAAVPSPLPLFGASAAFAWSRRLRRRVTRGATTALPAQPE